MIYAGRIANHFIQIVRVISIISVIGALMERDLDAADTGWSSFATMRPPESSTCVRRSEAGFINFDHVSGFDVYYHMSNSNVDLIS